jgi:hypothetical protein
VLVARAVVDKSVSLVVKRGSVVEGDRVREASFAPFLVQIGLM